MPNENQTPTLDQKLKAVEIACAIIPPGNPPDSEAFNQYMDEYFSTIKGIAALILRTASWVQV
jgi:hypothetical protein